MFVFGVLPVLSISIHVRAPPSGARRGTTNSKVKKSYLLGSGFGMSQRAVGAVGGPPLVVHNRSTGSPLESPPVVASLPDFSDGYWYALSVKSDDATQGLADA